MKSVRFKFLIFILIFGMPYQVYTSCDTNVINNTAETVESWINTATRFVGKVFGGGYDFDPKLLRFIKVRAVKGNSFFNPRIEVCTYEGERCTQLSTDALCHSVYGLQETGGGVSAKVFIDWEGIEEGKRIVEQGDNYGKNNSGLEWQWADGVTPEEKEKFQNSPKICACSQKDACVTSFLSSSRGNFCDTCLWDGVQQTIKCAPFPRAPSPPPFCEHLPCSAPQPQVEIIPIKDVDNDYFLPKVRVKIGKEIQELYVLKNDLRESNSVKPQPQGREFQGRPHYFKTDRRNGKICARYCGTKKEECDLVTKFPERCFPAPHAPQPEIEEVVNNNTLKIKIKMSEQACLWIQGLYNSGYCMFDINNHDRMVGDNLVLRVVKPKMMQEQEQNILFKQVLDKQKQFKILTENKCIPSVEHGKNTEAIQYKEETSNQAKMLCISGWKPDPEQSILVDPNSDLILLRLEGTKYVKCPAVYSFQSNKMFYGKCDDAELPQDKLDKVAFDIADNMFFSDERGAASCNAENDKEAENELTNAKCLVYKLEDSQVYIKNDNSTEYTKQENRFDMSEYFSEEGKFDLKKYFKYLKKNNKLFALIKVEKSEVFYADKLCAFDLNSLKADIRKSVMEEINKKKEKKSKEEIVKFSSTRGRSGNLSKYESVDIEVWGNGKDGRLFVESKLEKNGKFVESHNYRPGKPGDYIKVKLKINKDYPFIYHYTANQGSIIVQMCSSTQDNRKCKPLIKVAGGERSGNAKTMIYKDGHDLRIGEATIIQSNTNDKSSRGSKGGVVNITPIYSKTTQKETNDIIDKIIKNIMEKNLGNDQNLVMGGLDVSTIKKIVEEGIKQELSCENKNMSLKRVYK